MTCYSGGCHRGEFAQLPMLAEALARRASFRGPSRSWHLLYVRESCFFGYRSHDDNQLG